MREMGAKGNMHGREGGKRMGIRLKTEKVVRKVRKDHRRWKEAEREREGKGVLSVVKR